mmetsp:Transcript_48699/g.91181  ORF Transcript_48699/g.91181 Transcript_48699/m.91181 type:complete len:123 (+) Transcript_48699:2-370(+)
MDNPGAKVLADTLNTAVGKLMDERKSPSRKVMEIDTRGSHFYLALYWAEALAEQSDDPKLKDIFVPVATQLFKNEGVIMEQFTSAQGKPVDMKGYYAPSPFQLSQLMRPSPEFNSVIDAISA